MRASPAEKGLGLVEVLVALFLFVVSLLGAAAMMTAAKRTEFDSYQRSLANNVANSISERIHANPAQVAAYDTGRTNPLGTRNLSLAGNTDCRQAACSAVEVAAFDLWDFEQMLVGSRITYGSVDSSSRAGGLLSPNACILFTAGTAGGQLRIIVSWQDRRETRDAVAGDDAVSEVCGATGAGGNAYRRNLVVDTYVF